jgi:hypothetical protein
MQRGWLVRGANVQGHDLVPDWLENGYCSVAYEYPSGEYKTHTRAELGELVGKYRPDHNLQVRAHHAGVMDRFLNQVQPGDLVTTVDGHNNVHVGIVTSQPTWHASNPLSIRRRAVRWRAVEPPLNRHGLPDAVQKKLKARATVTELGEQTVQLAQLAGIAADIESSIVAAPPRSLPAGEETPERTGAEVQRVIRITAVAQAVKGLHDNHCQVCATRLDDRDGGYGEAAHIRGLGHPHDGPDMPSNVLCLCPNHHVLFDRLSIYIDDDFTVRHTSDHGAVATLRRDRRHVIDPKYIRYHRDLCLPGA